MARVSLIPLYVSNAPWPTERLASFRQGLERAGYSVGVDVGGTDPATTGTPQGLAVMAVDRIRAATGIYFVVVDLAMDYTLDDVLAVVERLETGSAALVVASRRGRWFGSVARRFSGISDLGAGLAGLTQGAARIADRLFAPVGSRFVWELLARVEGKVVEVEVDSIASSGRRWSPMADIRHAKRIADHRFGNISRLLQFCFVGATGMVVDLSTYAALQAILARTPLADVTLFGPDRGDGSISLAVAAAAVLSIVGAMTWNFSLNRRLTFNDARRGPIARQYLRYVLSNLLATGVSLAFRLLLPGSIGFFARHRLAAAVAGIIVATGISFSMARWFVFGNRPSRQNEPILADHPTRVDPRHDQQPGTTHRSLASFDSSELSPVNSSALLISQE